MRTLLHRLIDYAGVFPPAALPLEEALDEYLLAVGGPHGWMLGPCLVRSSQLTAIDSWPDDRTLGAVLDEPIESAPAPPLAQIEGRSDPLGIERVLGELTRWSGVVYVESSDPAVPVAPDRLARIRSDGTDVRAKIRTGGASAAAFPDVETVARFVVGCVEHDVPFKATAGLHHPIRHPSAVEGAIEHGFVNILAAVRAAIAQDRGAVTSALASTDLAEFDLQTLSWDGVGATSDPARVRCSFRSFGSCSFDEPVDHLAAIGILDRVDVR